MLIKELCKDLNPYRASIKMYSRVFHMETVRNFSSVRGSKQNLSQGQRYT